MKVLLFFIFVLLQEWLAAYALPSILKGDLFMSISKFQHYFDELDIYLELRDLALSTKLSYRSHLKSYLTWISETGIVLAVRH